jgi:pimeloyl-ACP methyl ester carboxylesterase
MLLINGHNLYIEQTGPENGPTVVLLHHGLGSVRAWRGQTEVLAEAGFRVVVYDRWGYGGSDARLGLDLPAFTTDLIDLSALLEQLHIQRTALLGHSDGGTIALYFAAQQPSRVMSLVTVAAHIYVEAKMEPGILGIRQAFETDESFRMGLKLAHGDKYESVFHNWFDGWQCSESLGWDMRLVLGQIRCPALIVQGEEDEHATPKHAKDIAGAISGGEVWLIPGVKHMVPQEITDKFNTKVLQFLKDHIADEL